MMNSKLIAPCGMNCAICKGYLREKNKCRGCRAGRIVNSKRIKCAIKNCPRMKENNWQYCFQCEVFPCARMKRLDKRYRTNYGMSMFENLEYIKKKGIKKFVQRERKRRMKDGKMLCVHDKKYY